MRSIAKKRSPLSASNAKKLKELCDWITDNCEQTLGWSQLTQHSGFSKEQLIELFVLYRQVTPMAFVRQVRKHHQNNLANHLNPQLFDTVQHLVNDSDSLI